MKELACSGKDIDYCEYLLMEESKHLNVMTPFLIFIHNQLINIFMANWTNKNCNNKEFYDQNLLADNDRLFKSSVLAQLKSISERMAVIENKLNISDSDKVCASTDKWEIRKKNINECIESMDWSRIHKVMEFLDWHWCSESQGGNFGVPSIETLKNRTRSDLERCFESMDECNEENDGDVTDSYCIYSGGIKVRTFDDDNCEVYFILSDVSTLY